MTSSAHSRTASVVESREPIDHKTPRRLKADPLAPILALGSRQRRFGAILAIAGTLVVHGAPATQAARSLADMREFSKHVLDTVRQRLKSEIDIDNQPPPPPPPPPPPEPEPPPAREAAPPKAAAEPPPPPPSPAQAGKVLTQEADPDEPVDLTGEGFVTGNGDRFVGGVTSNTGKSTQPVRQAAVQDGAPNGTGTVKAPPPPPAEDLSRAPVPLVTGKWQCGFPSEADVENVNLAYVTLVVTVGPEGRASSASVVREEPSGLGFGARARQCALRTPFQAGLDSAGRPTTKSTAPIRIRFER
ncbi:MAG TPA: hypothetical protein VG937_24785 [Polyangiaceae bacterium]|nr:hypothetical protein [Polyangiaceae bacterium]